MLTLAATPIGNLGDASPRLARALESADLILAEDTRQTRKLLQHLGIDKPMSSFHEHTPEKILERVDRLLAEGQQLVYVSDAGTPVISDPGFELVRLAHKRGHELDAIPGPCAAINALVLSGLPSHEFCFLGFFPTTREKRVQMLARLRAIGMTSIFYEGFSRIESALHFLAEAVPRAQLAMAREMTKLHQQVLVGTAAEVLARLETVKGEFALVIEPLEATDGNQDLETRIGQLLAEGLGPNQAAKRLSQEFRLPKRDVYQKIQALKGEVGAETETEEEH